MARRSKLMGANPFGAALAWQKAAWDYQRMSMAAAQVIWHRSLQMGMGVMTPAEATRMVLEKPAAFALGLQRSAMALAGGRAAPAIAAAALRPVSTAARANARRLGRRR